MPVLRAREPGDMYVQVLVETPQKLTKRRKNCCRNSTAIVDRNPAEAAGFFSKVKEFLDGLGNRPGSA
jgi:molecular chaperone DnaJ